MRFQFSFTNLDKMAKSLLNLAEQRQIFLSQLDYFYPSDSKE